MPGKSSVTFFFFFYSFGKSRVERKKKKKFKSRKNAKKRILRSYRVCQVRLRTVYDLLISGSSSVRRARAWDSISHVEAVDGLYGDPAQERHRGKTSVKVRDAFHRRRRRGHLLHKLPRGGPIRSGRLHQGIHGLACRSAWRHRREASPHALLQISHQLQQEELRADIPRSWNVQSSRLYPKMSACRRIVTRIGGVSDVR